MKQSFWMNAFLAYGDLVVSFWAPWALFVAQSKGPR
jgi:hypothetical protein